MTDVQDLRRIIGITFLACVAVSACGRREGGGRAEVTNAAAVTTWKITLDRITHRLEVTGEVRPIAVVQLASKVGGRLEWLGVGEGQGRYVPLSEGTRVRRGDVVAHIDLEVYAARYRQAEAAYALAAAQHGDAVREEARIRTLFEEGSATQQMLDKAITAKEIARAALTQAEAALDLARFEREEAQLKSPIDGVVTKKLVDEGNVISPGMPLAVLQDIRRVRVVASVAERYVPHLVEGKTRVVLRTDSLPDTEIVSVLTKVYPHLDSATRTATIEVVLDNEDGRLRPGNFARVTLDLVQIENAVVIPLSAVSWQGKEAFVYVVAEGHVRRRPIRVGVREGERCQITEGLQAGERLVVGGSQGLKDGDEVTVEEGPFS